MANKEVEEKKTKQVSKSTKENKASTKKTTTKKVETKKKSATKKEETKKQTAPKKVEKIAEEKKIEEKMEVQNEENKNDIIKAVIIAVLLIIFFIAITAIGNTSKKGTYSKSTTNNSTSATDASSQSASISEDEMGDLNDIGIDEYLELKKNSEKYSIIYIGRPTCSHCEIQKPIMQYMVYKYGVEINYLDTDKLDNDGIGKLQKSDDYFSEGWGTPLVLIVNGDRIIDKSEGETSIEELEELFKEYDLIKK